MSKRRSKIPNPIEIYMVAIAISFIYDAIILAIIEKIEAKEREQSKPKERLEIVQPKEEENLEILPIESEESKEFTYNDKVYDLNHLYRLSNDEATYLCHLDPETYYYYDLNTEQAIAIEGYEDFFHYQVEDHISKEEALKYMDNEEMTSHEKTFVKK